MENFRPNEQRAKNATILIWIVMSVEIMSLISSYFQYNLLKTVSNGAEISGFTAAANDLREQIIGSIYLITYIISAVTFILWFRRAYFNLHIKVNNLSHDEGWAAGSWFVPIISLFRPYQIMKELYQRTKYLLTKNQISVDENYSTKYLGWWWTLWIINNFIGQFIFRYSTHAETLDELTISTIANMIGNLVGIPLALITVKVIKDYSNIELLLLKIKDSSFGESFQSEVRGAEQ